MGSDPKFEEFPGMFGGFAVKRMIETMEERMAAGEHVSAAPSSQYEAESLQQVKKENDESAKRSRESQSH